MRISVGSKNPVKIKAVESAVRKIWPEAEIISVDAPSGVSEQPPTDDEAITGAKNRAKISLQKTNADLGIGLEGNTVDTKHGMIMSGWVAAVDRRGNYGLGGSGSILLPEKIASEVRKGKELGPVMDKLLGDTNTKQKHGAVGHLTNHLVPRAVAAENSVIYALARFINPKNYQ